MNGIDYLFCFGLFVKAYVETWSKKKNVRNMQNKVNWRAWLPILDGYGGYDNS